MAFKSIGKFQPVFPGPELTRNKVKGFVFRHSGEINRIWLCNFSFDCKKRLLVKRGCRKIVLTPVENWFRHMKQNTSPFLKIFCVYFVIAELVEYNQVEKNSVYGRLFEGWPNKAQPFKPILPIWLIWLGWPSPVRPSLKRTSLNQRVQAFHKPFSRHDKMWTSKKLNK